MTFSKKKRNLHHEEYEGHEVWNLANWRNVSSDAPLKFIANSGLDCWNRHTEQCFAHELSLNGIQFKIQHPLPVHYKGICLDCGYRIDLLVENEIILELKSVDELKKIHEAQLLTYMKLSGMKHGFLLNFNATRLKQGMKSFLL